MKDSKGRKRKRKECGSKREKEVGGRKKMDLG